jgi:cysteine desulfurase / selenocysteine lyase
LISLDSAMMIHCEARMTRLQVAASVSQREPERGIVRRSQTLSRTAVSRLREHFPSKPAGAYLDTASIGLVPTEVAAAVAECYAALGAGTSGSARWRPVVEKARSAFASEFGVGEDEISFMASTGEAMNAIARAVRWRPDDEILALSGEFPTVTLPWLRLGAGVRLVEVDPLAGDDRLGALLAAIGTHTRVVAVSHISSFTGTQVDLDTLGQACAQAGATLVVDGAQSAGAIPLTLDHVDFYIATGYKWLLAGFGVAVVVSKRASMLQMTPTLLGYGNQAPPPALAFGHLNLPGVYALAAAAAVRQSVGLEAIYARIAQLARRVYNETVAMGYSPVAALERSGGIVSLRGISEAQSVAARLAAAGVAVAERGGYLRISPNFYTADREIDLLLTALNDLRATR